METVPPHAMNRKWKYRWFGVEQSRNAQLNQQKVAYLNVMMQQSQNPAFAAAGYRFNPVPATVEITEAILGPRTAKRTLQKLEDQFTIDPKVENMMMEEGHDAMVSPFDNHQKHMQVHQELAMHPNPIIAMRAQNHIKQHQQAMMQQAMAAMMQQAAQQMNPGGQQPQMGGGGGARKPRAGAQTTMPRTGQQPAGAVHRDQMAHAGGVIPMPRRAG